MGSSQNKQQDKDEKQQDLSTATHVSISIDGGQLLGSCVHPLVAHLRAKYSAERFQTTTGDFRILSVDEQEFFDLDIKEMLTNEEPLTRYEWEIPGPRESKGSLVVYIMQHPEEGPVLLNTFPPIKRTSPHLEIKVTENNSCERSTNTRSTRYSYSISSRRDKNERFPDTIMIQSPNAKIVDDIVSQLMEFFAPRAPALLAIC